MTLIEIIKILQQIAFTQPNVRTATDGDIYEVMNGNPSVKYGVFHITQNNHQTYDEYDIYNLNLFYIDRNEDDNANTLQIQSIGKSVIDNIIKSFCEKFDVDFPRITYTPFTQRFNDDTAGVFAGIELQVYKDWSCAEGYGDYIAPIIMRNQTKTVKITESGIYDITYDEGYTGLENVIIDAELADTVQPVKSVEITQNTTVSVLPDEPYLSMGEVEVNVNIPVGYEDVEITQNGSYEITPSIEYEYLKGVNVDVNIPLQENKSVTLNDNGVEFIFPDEGYEGFSSLRVEVDYNPDVKLKIPNRLSFSGSTWETFDMGAYDWSDVYCFQYLFNNCRNLRRIYNFPSDIIPYGSTTHMCYNTKLEEAPYFDMQYIGTAIGMFYGAYITTIPQYDMNNVLSVQGMFRNCYRLVYLPLLNWGSVVETNECFNNCTALSSVEGFKNLRTSIDMKSCPLTVQSVKNIIEYAYDFTANAETPDTNEGILKISSSVFESIDDEVKARAAEKGWTIAV